VVALTKVHPVGYSDWQNEEDKLRQQVLRDKKFDMLAQKLKDVKTIADAQKQGATIDTVPVITFANAVYLPSTHASEPALSGAVAAVKQGEMSKKPVKGQQGAYLFQVLKRGEREGAKFDEKQQEQTLKQEMSRLTLNYYMQELYEKANVVDNRYLFF